MIAAARIGDQLILEEDYDENDIPSEQEIKEYAKEIGIDPDTEPELMWLAREGIVAPLPPEWKPCQDVTGDIYYFNFSTGQSTWDHPCDEHYRRLVAEERERTQHTVAAGVSGVKKEKKKKKEKKEKKEKKKKEPFKTPGTSSSALGPLPSQLGSLAPLRGLDAPALGPLRGSTSALRQLEPLESSFGALRSSGASRVLGSRQEEKVSLTLPGFDDEDDEDKISENEPSARVSDRLPKNLQLDLDALGGGLQYEDSKGSGTSPAEEMTEPELQDFALSGDHSPEPPSQQDSLRGRHLRLSPLLGDQNHFSETASGVISPEPEHSAAQEEAQGLSVERVEREVLENEDVQKEKGEDDEGETEKRDDGEDQDEKSNKSKEGSEIEEEERGSEGFGKEERVESDEVEEECGESEDENVEWCIESHKEEIRLINENTECLEALGSVMKEKKEEAQEFEEVDSKVVEESLKSDADEEDSTDKERKMDGKRKKYQGRQNRCKGKEEEAHYEGGQEKDREDEGEREKAREDEGESEEGLQRCSLSQRKLTESDDDVLERCVQSEGRETEGEEMEEEDESDAQKPQTASESDEEVIRVFEMDMARVCSANRGKKMADLKTQDQKRKSCGDKMKMVINKCPHPAELSEKILELHQTSPSPSLSSPSPFERDVRPRPKAEALGPPQGLQRPETSRGPPVDVSNKIDGVEPHRKNDESSLKEPNWRIHKDSERGETKEEEKEKEKRAEREERNLRQRNEEREREQRKVDYNEEEEIERLMREREKRICLLQEKLRREEEEEEEKLMEENKERLRALRQHLLSERREEEARLNEESERMLEEVRESVEKKRDVQERKFREESEAMLKDLRHTLEEERAVERDRLEAQKRRDMERLKAESEEELQTERSSLQEGRAEKPNYLKQKLADVLQEVREEVQRDHERKLEQLREDHRREMNNIREKYLDEEERERLQASHTLQLEELRLQRHARLEDSQMTHSRKESELRDLSDQLELRAKELQSHEAMLQTKTLPRLIQERDQLKQELERMREEKAECRELIHKLREERSEAKQEEELLKRERDQLHVELQRMREEKTHARELIHKAREEAKQEEERLRWERDKAREESRKAKEEKEQLESKVALLQERCDRLSRRVSELEAGEAGSAPKQDKNAAPSSDHRDASLHVGDLEDPPISPVPDSHTSEDEFQRYIPPHTGSIQKIKHFLERESRLLMDGQNRNQEGRVTEEIREQQPLFTELSRLAGERKVTFDVTDSDLSSTVDPPVKTGDHPTVPESKVQELTESLQQISGQLSSVQTALGSLQRQSSTPLTGFPLSQPHPTPAPTSVHTLGPTFLATAPLVGLPEPHWNWVPPGSSTAGPIFSTPITSGLRASDDIINSRWSQIFPGAAMEPMASSSWRTSSKYAPYSPARDHGRSLQPKQNPVEVDGQRLQEVIDSNKRWLEMRKKDTSIPLFTRYQAPPTRSRLVQLGLDDKNQIRVYHY
ncbi:uncharacterized protein cep164 isoform 2-T2 [Aulostomus maculatus]